jgi:hypothetical protein
LGHFEKRHFEKLLTEDYFNLKFNKLKERAKKPKKGIDRGKGGCYNTGKSWQVQGKDGISRVAGKRGGAAGRNMRE